MIYESYPWKQDLLQRKRLIQKYNRVTLLSDDNYDRAYTVIEKAVFYSAFIIRKLVDCKVKVSDEVDAYKFALKGVRPLKNVDLMHHWPDEGTHDWEHEESFTKFGTDICNWIIHSRVFFFAFAEDKGIIDSFYVSSDFDRNKLLYRVNMQDWIKYMEFVGNDCIVSMNMHIDECKKDYVLTKKERDRMR